MKYIIFTDMDGTLIDYHNYSFEGAQDALDLIKDSGIPLILTTSKTRVEVLRYIDMLGINDPFIVENGGGIYFPSLFKGTPVEAGTKSSNYREIVSGVKKDYILSIINEIRDDFNIKLFSDFSDEELSRFAEMKIEDVRLSKMRDFTEPFMFKENLSDSRFNDLCVYIKRYGLKILKGGRFFHLVGLDQDKGKAVMIVKKIIEDIMSEKPVTIGLGDSKNDYEMLKVVDIPVLIRKYDDTYEDMHIDGLTRSKLPGPAGFNETILNILR